MPIPRSRPPIAQSDPTGNKNTTLPKEKAQAVRSWWSPDGRFVACLAIASMFAGGLALDVENYRLRVRRLSDKFEDDWVADSAADLSIQWVINPNLLKQKTLVTMRRHTIALQVPGTSLTCTPAL